MSDDDNVPTYTEPDTFHSFGWLEKQLEDNNMPDMIRHSMVKDITKALRMRTGENNDACVAYKHQGRFMFKGSKISLQSLLYILCSTDTEAHQHKILRMRKKRCKLAGCLNPRHAIVKSSVPTRQHCFKSWSHLAVTMPTARNDAAQEIKD